MLRCLFLRVRVFAAEGYGADEMRSILGSVERELKESSSERETQVAMEALAGLVQRDEAATPKAASHFASAKGSPPSTAHQFMSERP
jgi:hypothetical protein